MNNEVTNKLLNNIVVSVIGKLSFPIILLLAFYIQINGENAPGGGFQAGVIGATAFILHRFIFNKEITLSLLNPKFLTYLSALGLLIYLLTGVMCIMLGGNFLEFELLNSIKLSSKIGIAIIEWCIGLTVFSTICKIYYCFL
jgi:multicomponent Na+:H+ antiporter subunit B